MGTHLEMLNVAHGDVSWWAASWATYGVWRLASDNVSSPRRLGHSPMLIAAMVAVPSWEPSASSWPSAVAPGATLGARHAAPWPCHLPAEPRRTHHRHPGQELQHGSCSFPLSWNVNIGQINSSSARAFSSWSRWPAWWPWTCTCGVPLRQGHARHQQRTGGRALHGISVNLIITSPSSGSALAGWPVCWGALLHAGDSHGFSAGIKAFTAAVLGGIATCGGPCWVALCWAWPESLAIAFISPVYKEAIALVIRGWCS